MAYPDRGASNVFFLGGGVVFHQYFYSGQYGSNDLPRQGGLRSLSASSLILMSGYGHEKISNFHLADSTCQLIVIGIVGSALAYCTGNTDSIPSCSKDSKSQLVPAAVLYKQFGLIQSVKGNGDSVTEGFCLEIPM